MSTSTVRHRIVIVGGGFGGVYTAIHLGRIWRRSGDADIVLVSRDNYFLMTPFLFEAGSGVLDPRHAVAPIRRLLNKSAARFVEADVESIDFDRRVVHARHAAGDRDAYEIPYDQLVLSLGGVTNLKIIPGSEHALTFKTLADAIYLRNHVIDAFEHADATADEAQRRRLLSFVVIGAGLVGVELMGELTAFVRHISRSYPRTKDTPRTYHLVEAGPNILPEMERDLADYAEQILVRRGVVVHRSSPAAQIGPGFVRLPTGEPLQAHTIVLSAGVAANPLLATFPVEKHPKGRVLVDATMRSTSHPNVWAVGDCAVIPDPTGKPYPQLAQHALREARVLADNITATLRGGPLKPFVYQTLGTLASLGDFQGVGRVMKLKVRGFIAWWVWRSYYLMQMPRFERKLRIVLDWTVALFFKHDIVKLDLFGEKHPLQRGAASPPPASSPPASSPPQTSLSSAPPYPSSDGVSPQPEPWHEASRQPLAASPSASPPAR